MTKGKKRLKDYTWEDLKDKEARKEFKGKIIKAGIVVVTVFAVIIIIGSLNNNNDDVGEAEVNNSEKVNNQDEQKLEGNINEVDEEESANEVETSWDDLKGDVVGKSAKDFLELTSSEPRDVRNDTTESWKKSTISESVDILEYLSSYKDLYMSEGDTHWIINFSYNTTTRIYFTGGLLYIDITEYVNKEEHNADILGTGMLLGSYVIYPDGDIEELNTEA